MRGAAPSPLAQIEQAVQKRAKDISLEMTAPGGEVKLRALIADEVARWNDDHRRTPGTHRMLPGTRSSIECAPISRTRGAGRCFRVTVGTAARPTTPTARARVDRVEWGPVAEALDDVGVAATGSLLTAAECRALADLYDDDGRFRSTVDMARHRYGEGQYRYFAHPLPDLVAELRGALWPHLLPIAREWAARVGRPAPWPDDLDDWLARCHAAGQTRPTPLLLRYGPGDWNALHRDLYGELVFPLQVVVGLDEPGTDYAGGEFVVVEQRPHAQSRATATAIPQGHGLVFTTRDRPVLGRRGWSRAPMRHGVSVVRSGRRRTLGLVFHDAA